MSPSASSSSFPTSVSILGCGWMGRALGQYLVDRVDEVRGSTTSPEKLDPLRDDGIDPVLLTLDPDLSGDDPASLFHSSVLVLNIPPSRGSGDVQTRHPRQVAAVRDAAVQGAVDWVLFASSTGVYPNVDQTVTEADCPPGDPESLPGPRRSTGEALLTAEDVLMESELDTTVVRLAGLYGPDRPPGRFLAGRVDVSRPKAPVNLIHRDDCVGVFATVIEQNLRNEVYNACADEHPSREAFYTQAATLQGLAPPSFDEEDVRSGKLVSNEKLKDHSGYDFRHPDPLADLEDWRV